MAILYKEDEGAKYNLSSSSSIIIKSVECVYVFKKLTSVSSKEKEESKMLLF